MWTSKEVTQKGKKRMISISATLKRSTKSILQLYIPKQPWRAVRACKLYNA